MKNESNNNPQNEAMQYDTLLCPVIFEGRKYFGVREFDCHCVGLFTEETLQGTFFTVIPISPKEYRETSPTKAKVEISTENDWTVFKIFCDWGQCHIMQLHNTLKDEINTAKNAAIEQGIYGA
jgi:hypothetical protein